MNTITVLCICPFCGTTNQVSVNKQHFCDWQNGKLIQDALPELSVDNRELLMTGICTSCFPNDDDEY